MKIPKVFNDFQSLIKSLREKAGNYPLISKLYIPIIEKHIEEYSSDPDDWLIIPCFQRLYWSTDDRLGLDCRQYLLKTEEWLDKIKKNLGDSAFEGLCQGIFNLIKDPMIYGVLNKWIDFYAELKGMEYFIDRGYSIGIIKRSETGRKTPDFFAKKDNEIIVVECKFIHDSIDTRSYLKRYLLYLGFFPEFNSLYSIPLLNDFDFYYYPKIQMNLKSSVVNQIKEFVNRIIEEGLKSASIELGSKDKFKINYQYEEGVGLGLITIDNQVESFITPLEEFFNDYVLRRKGQAIEQFEDYDADKKVVYIVIEYNQEYNMPWDKMALEKLRIQEDLKVKYEHDIELILDLFPPLNLK